MAKTIKTLELVSALRDAYNSGATTIGVGSNGSLKGFDLDFNAIGHVDLDKQSFVCHNLSNSELEIKPEPAKSSLKKRKTPKSGRHTGDYTVKFCGKSYQCSSKKDVLIFALGQIEKKYPGTFEKLKNILPKTKRIVSKDRNQLYKNKPLSFAEKHSTASINGWWIATNNSGKEISKWLARACDEAGIYYYIDLHVEPEL